MCICMSIKCVDVFWDSIFNTTQMILGNTALPVLTTFSVAM